MSRLFVDCIHVIMQRLMTRFMKLLFGLPIAVLFMAPLMTSLAFMLMETGDLGAWQAVVQHPQLWGGLALSLFTGTVASAIAAFIAVLIAASFHERGQGGTLARGLSAMLAVPHLAFAIGFGFLVMPSGLLARAIALAFTGWSSPPLWTTTHDPYGIALIIALAVKESGFLLFVLTNILAREDVRQSFVGQRAAAQGLGHGTLSIWLRLFLPQLWPQLVWPLVIVFIYAATVVDMSLVLGPTQPPTFGDVVWSDINSAHVADVSRGRAGALLLALVAGLEIALFVALSRLCRPAMRLWRSRGPSGRALPAWLGIAKWRALQVFYVAVFVTLLVLSFAPLWPFPWLLPDNLDASAWSQVGEHAAPLVTSLLLAVSTSLCALVLLVLWFEAVPPVLDRALLIVSLAMLGLPALLIGLGQYALFLRLGLTGTAVGLFLAHLMPVIAYMFIMLKGPYRASDPRRYDVSIGLGVSDARFLIRIKWPLLKAPMLASVAVGFAVSFGQFVPAQLVAAGRFSTLTMEAVTLTSGTNRPLAAAFALLLMLPPLLVFLGAGLFGRSRWRPA
jgi:putative thiamine transport system permease protein